MTTDVTGLVPFEEHSRAHWQASGHTLGGVRFVLIELSLAVAVVAAAYGLGFRHWRTMPPGRAVAQIFGWYLIAIGTLGLLEALPVLAPDVDVPGRVIAYYSVEIVFGYFIKAIAGSYWPIPRRHGPDAA